MHRTVGRALAAVAVAAAVMTPAAAALAGTRPAPASPARVALAPPGPALLAAAPERPGAGTGTGTGTGAGTVGPAARHVVLVGIGGLRWSDVSPSATPALWRLAGHGSIAALLVSGVAPRTCPADGWLTLNGAERAAVAHGATGPCPALPAVVSDAGQAGQAPAAARVPAMSALAAANGAYAPAWGLLASAPGGGCATAVGPGAALALAGRSGQVGAYLPAASGLTRSDLARCPLTVIDLGSLPAGTGAGNAGARSAALRAADRALAAISARLAPDTTLIVAAPGGATPHLRVLVVIGPGFGDGLLTTASTHQMGMVLLTDLTPNVAAMLGGPVPQAVGLAPLRAVPRSSLAAAVATLRSQDVAAQVWRSTVTPFYQLVGFGYPALFGLIWVAPWGRGERRRPRRRAIARFVGLWAAGLPAGTLLASLASWPSSSHPAGVLYSLAVAWAAAIAAAALAGPWRRDPLGPAGVVAAVTLAVVSLDLITGTHLLLETPFGISLLLAGRFYGLANNAVVVYAASGIVCAAWVGSVLLRRGRRSGALAVMGAVAAFTVGVAAWPGFGAKVGGTIAMVPGFLVLLAAAAKIRITPRRALLVAVSGLAVVVVVAVVSYVLPLTGQSDITGFVGKSLHGGAGAILARKVNSNLSSLTANPFIPVIPVVLVLLGLAVAWPARMRATLLVRAYAQIPLLKAALSAIWLVAVLGWFSEDSGATVPAAGMPLVLPLVIVILSSLPESGGGQAPAARAAAAADRGVPAHRTPAIFSLARTNRASRRIG